MLNQNNKMILYHGSDHIIENPLFGSGKTDNDYGQGFYCTKDKELAKEWSCQNNKDGVVNSYELDLTDLKILYLNNKKYSVLNWLTILLENRKIDSIENDESIEFLFNSFCVDTSNYDIITGWRADDSYFTFAKNFLNNGLSIQSLEKAMKLGKLGIQVMLKSEKSFSQIKFVNAEKIDRKVFYEKFTERDKQSRESYKEIRKSQRIKDSIFLTDIIKNPQLLKEYEKSKSDDFSLTR